MTISMQGTSQDTWYIGPRMGFNTSPPTSVMHRAKGVIPNCVPSVPNSASSRETRWPESSPMVRHGGTRMSVYAKTYLEQLRLDVEGSRRFRGQPEHVWGDPW